MLTLAEAAPPVLALGLSGGGDSVALMHALRARFPDVALHTLIVDHGLRPQSGDEARRAARWSEAVGAHPHILKWDTPRPGQAHARAARHHLLAEKTRELGAQILCLGHTLDDRIETLRMRAARSGPASRLVGPRPLDASPVWPAGCGVTLARPFLAVRRATLRAYLEQLGVNWIDDPSNDDTSYERIRLRQAPIDARHEQSLLTESDQAALARETARHDAFALIERAVSFASWSGARLDREAFSNAPLKTAYDAAEALILAVSGRTDPAEPKQLTAFVDCLRAGKAWTSGGAVLTGDGWLGRDPGAAGRADGQRGVEALALKPGQSVVFDGRWQVRAGKALTLGLLGATPTELAASVPAVFRPGLVALRDETGAILALAGLKAESVAEMELLGAARIRAWLLPQSVPAWFDVDRPALEVHAALAKPVSRSNIVS